MTDDTAKSKAPIPDPAKPLQGPFIVWTNYGYEGWHPTSYNSLNEALAHNGYGSTTVITKLATFQVIDTTK